MFASLGLASAVWAQEDCVEFLNECQNRDDRSLHLSLPDDGESLDWIGALDWVTFVSIGSRADAPYPVDLTPLLELEDFDWLDLENVTPVSMAPLGQMPIRRLGLKCMDGRGLSVLSELANLEFLKVFDLRGTVQIDFGQLSGLNHLSVVDTELADLQGVDSLTRLRALVLANTSQNDFSSLSGLNETRARICRPFWIWRRLRRCALTTSNWSGKTACPSTFRAGPCWNDL